MFATASIATFFLALPSPTVQKLIITLLWCAFITSEMLVFCGIRQFEDSHSNLFQVPTLMLILCVGVNVLFYLVECGLLIGIHLFDSLQCVEWYALLGRIGEELYFILHSINTVALVWLGYAMSRRGLIWSLPALLAVIQIIASLTISSKFNTILYYATWPIFYSSLAWYYSKVAFEAPQKE